MLTDQQLKDLSEGILTSQLYKSLANKIFSRDIIKKESCATYSGIIRKEYNFPISDNEPLFRKNLAQLQNECDKEYNKLEDYILNEENKMVANFLDTIIHPDRCFQVSFLDSNIMGLDHSEILGRKINRAIMIMESCGFPVMRILTNSNNLSYFHHMNDIFHFNLYPGHYIKYTSIYGTLNNMDIHRFDEIPDKTIYLLSNGFNIGYMVRHPLEHPSDHEIESKFDLAILQDGFGISKITFDF